MIHPPMRIDFYICVYYVYCVIRISTVSVKIGIRGIDSLMKALYQLYVEIVMYLCIDLYEQSVIHTEICIQGAFYIKGT